MNPQPVSLHDELDAAMRKARETKAELLAALDTVDTVLSALMRASGLRSEVKRGGTLARVVRIVAEVTDTTPGHLRSDRRARDVSWPRLLAYLAGKRFTEASLPQIARALGDRDHTTVIYGCRRAEELIVSDPQMAEWWADIERRLS